MWLFVCKLKMICGRHGRVVRLFRPKYNTYTVFIESFKLMSSLRISVTNVSYENDKSEPQSDSRVRIYTYFFIKYFRASDWARFYPDVMILPFLIGPRAWRCKCDA